jgi:hypothetical protein
MKTYTIAINESYTRYVTIELEDEYDIGDAIAEARSDYYDEKIVLDYSDFDDVDFNEVNED